MKFCERPNILHNILRPEIFKIDQVTEVVFVFSSNWSIIWLLLVLASLNFFLNFCLFS